MAIQPPYADGIVRLTAGSAVVRGADTAWALRLVNGGNLSFGGRSIPIKSVTNDTELTLAYPSPVTYEGIYAIDLHSAQAASLLSASSRLADVIAGLNAMSALGRALVTAETDDAMLDVLDLDPDLFAKLTGASFTGSIGLGAVASLIASGVDAAGSGSSRVVSDLASFRSGNPNPQGAIVFTAPASTNFIFHQVEIKGFNYNPAQTIDLTIQFYRFNESLILTRCVSRGTLTPEVRLGLDGQGRPAIIVGGVATVWSYPHLAVTNALLGGAVTNAYCEGWTAALLASLSAYSAVTALSPLIAWTNETAPMFTQAQAEAGAAAFPGAWSPQRDAQAIAALEGKGVSLQATLGATNVSTNAVALARADWVPTVAGAAVHGVANLSMEGGTTAVVFGKVELYNVATGGLFYTSPELAIVHTANGLERHVVPFSFTGLQKGVTYRAILLARTSTGTVQTTSVISGIGS